ncbi:MAG: glycoside hydrolase [Chloroflexi bacterium]|nr:MAG: glycoside hydrolase [Chloroflexota bacterium]
MDEVMKMPAPNLKLLLEPLVEKNPFTTMAKSHGKGHIVSFQEAKKMLPEPVLSEHGGFVEMYWRAWEIAWANLRRPHNDNQFLSPYITAVNRPLVSLWESNFAALYGMYGRRAFNFMGALDNFYAHQQKDGFITKEISTENGADLFLAYTPNATAPNFTAWVEWRYYRATGDNGRLADVFWPLMAYHRWCRRNRTWPNGLYWATGESSNLYNQPRVPDSQYHHRHWTWVDANMQAILNCRVLEQFAIQLEQKELVQELADERAELIRMVNDCLWDEEASFYKDIDAMGRFSKVKSASAYWGLLDKDIIPGKRLAAFIRHLRESWAFKLNHCIPSLSADSEGYNSSTGHGYRGGVWPPLNYIVIIGLNNVGQTTLAHRIAVNHLENMWAVYQHTDTFWENYAPEAAQQGEPAEKDFVGPSGVSPISLLLENVIGVRADWPLRRVTWDRLLDSSQTYGVKNYPFGPDGTFDIVGDSKKVIVTTDVSFTLTIENHGFTIQTAVPSGTSEIDLT